MEAISGTRRAMKEMADGTIRVQVDIDPACRAAFLQLFPNIDMPVAIAPLIAKFEQKQPTKDEEGYGHHYTVLYMRGWWHNPKVIEAFGVDHSLPPEERIKAIKQGIYDECTIDSLTELEPHFFVQLCAAMGIANTVPREIAEAA